MRLQAAAAAAALLQGGAAAAQLAFPSTAAVPANLLRISIAFPTPPAAGETGRVWLSDMQGAEIPGAFYPQRLWSNDGRVLTVYLDPGRVKTGLKLRDDLGPILRTGQKIELRLGARVLKTWSVTSAHERPIAPRFQDVAPPRAGSRTALRLSFAYPIDHLDVDLIAVEGPTGDRVEGVGALSRGDRVWTFEPARPWARGRYVLRLNGDLEDPEGNRLASAFEVPKGRRAISQEAKSPFVIR